MQKEEFIQLFSERLNEIEIVMSEKFNDLDTKEIVSIPFKNNTTLHLNGLTYSIKLSMEVSCFNPTLEEK